MNNPMNNMTTKQRNFLIFCGVLVVGWYVIRLIGNASQQAAYYRQQAIIAAQQRAKALAAARVPSPAPPIRFSPPGLTTLTNLAGVWIGHGLIPPRGLCTLRLELRDADTPANYTGYSTLGCQPAPGVWGSQGGQFLPQDMRNNLSPKAIVMTGAPENGAIRFQVDKTVIGDSDICATTSFTITPFGTNKVAAQWREGTCRGVQFLLDKGGR